MGLKLTRVIIAVVCIGLIVVSVNMEAYAEDNDIRVYVNGRVVDFDVHPRIIEERVFVPVGAIVTRLEGRVEWIPRTRAIIIRHRNGTSIFTIGSYTVDHNGIKLRIDASPRIIDGRTLVPLRFISQTLGATVDWNDRTNIVTITTVRRR